MLWLVLGEISQLQGKCVIPRAATDYLGQLQ